MNLVKVLKKSMILAVIPLLLTPLVSACFSRQANDDTLIIACGGESTEGYDPTLGWGRYGNPLFQSTLLQWDDNLRIQMDLAKSYTLSADKLTWKVKIREDARFSDGTPLTASDVVYTFLQAKGSGGKVDLIMLESAAALDNYTVVFRLVSPSSTFINFLITLGIVPQHAHSASYSRNPIGSGPYKLISWQEGQQLIVEANPLYYGEQPRIKRVVFVFTAEDATLAALRAGKIHLGAVPQSFATSRIKGYHLQAVASVDNRGIMFPCVPAAGTKSIDGYPVGNNVTADPAIRKALNLIIDKQLIVDKILGGFGSPAYGIADNLPWDNRQARLAGPDEAEATQLLDKSGWTEPAPGAIRIKNGQKAEFTLLYPASDIIRQNLALASADMARKIGIDIKVTGKSWDEIHTLMHVSAVLFGWGSHDPLEIYNVYHSKNIGNGWYNTGYYANAQVDYYLDRAMAAGTYEEALKYWQLAQYDGQTGLSARGDAPWLWLVNLTHTYFVADNLDIGTSRIEPHGHGWPITANLTRWHWKN